MSFHRDVVAVDRREVPLGVAVLDADVEADPVNGDTDGELFF
jgi:hypothetical protein